MKLIVKLILFLLTLIAVAQANTPPLSSSYDLKQYDYGARYYDPRTSVWQSPDPILNKYMSGQTNVGVFNPQNLSLFSYTYNNPVNLVDPDGNNPKLLLDFGINLAITYATEGKLSWSAVKSAAVDTVTDAFNPMATVNKAKKLAKLVKFSVGEYKKIKGKVKGLDAHHVGQKALMKKHIKNYDEDTAPSILVPQVGHTIKKKGVGVVSRSTKIDITNPNTKSVARSIIARDVKEMRRVYPEVSNKQLQTMIKMNKQKYPELRK